MYMYIGSHWHLMPASLQLWTWPALTSLRALHDVPYAQHVSCFWKTAKKNKAAPNVMYNVRSTICTMYKINKGGKDLSESNLFVDNDMVFCFKNNNRQTCWQLSGDPILIFLAHSVETYKGHPSGPAQSCHCRTVSVTIKSNSTTNRTLSLLYSRYTIRYYPWKQA